MARLFDHVNMGLLLHGLLISIVVHGVRVLGTASKPHILHFMADDTGWNDLGYKNKLISSPNLDRLAMEGIRLTRHHAFKVCSPTRSSFHTGRYAFSMGKVTRSSMSFLTSVSSCVLDTIPRSR